MGQKCCRPDYDENNDINPNANANRPMMNGPGMEKNPNANNLGLQDNQDDEIEDENTNDGPTENLL